MAIDRRVRRFALPEIELDARLIFEARRDELVLARRHDRGLRDHRFAVLALPRDHETARGDVDQENTFDRAVEPRDFERRADRDDLFGVRDHARLATGDTRELLADGRHPRAAADEQDLLDLLALATTATERLLDRRIEALEQRRCPQLEL